MEQRLWSTVRALEPLRPLFVSVTYGAGGSTRERTHATVRRILQETTLKPAAHLTCVAASRAEVDAVVRDYWQAGVRHIVALRGDPPCGRKDYVPHPDGYRHAADLVAGIRRIGDFEVSVAAFPEIHPESGSYAEDMENLRRKVEAGASRAITQYFFDIEPYLRLRDEAAKAGIRIPIVPGLIPIGHFAQLVKFSAMCGASIPGWVAERFAPLDGDPRARDEAAIALALSQCGRLRAEGVSDFHFYTLNRADLTKTICERLGIVEYAD
jgi:methylenetetrahydrofolate reductase (NADPH)